MTGELDQQFETTNVSLLTTEINKIQLNSMSSAAVESPSSFPLSPTNSAGNGTTSSTSVVSPLLPTTTYIAPSSDSIELKAAPGKTLTIYGKDGRRHTFNDKGEELGNDPSTGYYEEVEIEDMDYDEELRTYSYPCPCGDRFQISIQQLLDGEDIAKCPSCSLVIKVIYDPEDFYEDASDSDSD